MKLLNFSIGQVQTIQFGAEVIKTAHIKAPVAEPWVITEDGAAGDRRAVHPDKLYAYARSSYDYWGNHLGIDPARWPDGFFGENLTLDTLDEEEVRVGDEFALGDEVRLVVAGARTPCAKLAWRLSQPRTFQRTFALSRRTGVYLGVLATGVVRPGDALRRIRYDPAMPSIADVCDFVASHAPPPLEPLRRLLAFAHLSPTIRLLLGSKLDAAERAAETVEGHWRGWRRFVIDQVVEEARDIRSFHLRPADGAALCPPRPGQFVSVRMTGDDGRPITRSWSLSAFAHDMAEYRLTVRRQSGAGSIWLHRAEAGAEVMLRAPAGDFVLDMGFRPVALVAAGIGITPLLAMLHAHLARPRPTPVYLIYGGRTPEELAFRAELDALAAAHPALTVTYVYSRSDAGGRALSRITPELVIGALAGLHVVMEDHRIELPWFEADIYLCGPGAFCTDLRAAFIARGANPDHIFLERFEAAAAEVSTLETAQVEFARSGVTLDWHANDDATLLDLAEQAGIAIESDCRAGTCQTCRTHVLAGETTAATGDGAALLCIGRPKTARLLLDA
ncbi:MOSC domain-containing protein [Sphingomonas bacterium]|uniref:MOSC domain-containing protein n=1 Tax=Sphingomonas bacterium TaxID=1895847 RepID=UPI0015767AF3|nr:MOSC domain-containing protein [Sphingomonas bacterium]